MKMQSILRTTLFAATLLFTFSLSAQTQPAPAGKAKMDHEDHGKQAGQKHDDDMSAQLNLTPEQKAKFEETDKNYGEKMKAARGSKEDMEKLHAEREQAHRAILNKDQAAKYDQMQADRKAKHEAHGEKMEDKKAEPKKGDMKKADAKKGKAKGKKPAKTTTPTTTAPAHERN